MGIAQDYLAGVQGSAQAGEATRKAAVYNALAHVYGPGAGEVQTKQSDIGYKNALAANTESETDERNQLLPGRVEDQPVQRGLQQAQTGEANARTDYTKAQTADTTAQAVQRQNQTHDQNRALVASLIANSDDPAGTLEKIAPTASHFGISDDEVDGVRQAIKADPAHAKTIADALMRKAYPQQFSTVGGIQYGQDADGNAIAITHNKSGQVSTQALGGITPTAVTNANNGTTRAGTGAEAEAERERHNQAMESAAQQRIAIAARNSAPLDDQTKDYLSDQVRTGRTDVLSRLNAAQRVGIYQDAAQKAAKEGKNGEADALNAQGFKARQVALDDMTKSTPNSMGGRIQSAGTLLDHLNTLSGLVTDLNSGNVQIKNAAQLRFKAEFGKAPPVEFNAQKTIVGDELARLLIANGGAAKDREKLIDEPLSRANSPAQLNGVTELIKGDVKARMMNARSLATAANLGDEFDKRSAPSLKMLLGTNPPPPAPPGQRTAAPAVAVPGTKFDLSQYLK